MTATWTIHPEDAGPGENRQLLILDREDGPQGRTVCTIQGDLLWRQGDNNFVRLLDEQDIDNARLIAAAPALRQAASDLIDWALSTQGWNPESWEAARGLLGALLAAAGEES